MTHLCQLKLRGGNDRASCRYRQPSPSVGHFAARTGEAREKLARQWLYPSRLLLTTLVVLLRAIFGFAIARGQAPPQQYLADDKTALLYHFNDCSGGMARDSSPHLRHGHLGAGAFCTPRSVMHEVGKTYFEKSVQMRSGDLDYVAWVDSGAGLHSVLMTGPAKERTFEGWFKVDGPTGSGANVLFVIQPVDAESPAVFDLKLEMMPIDEASSLAQRLSLRDARDPLLTTAPLEWQPWSWYHVAVTIRVEGERATYEVFRTRAGTPEAQLAARQESRAPVASQSTSDRMLIFGNDFGVAATSALHGRIDEVRLSTKVRTPPEFKLTLGPSVDECIRVEATGMNSESDHPLPLASTWDTGTQSIYPQYGEGYTPKWQLETISSGHHLLPAIVLYEPLTNLGDPAVLKTVREYYVDALAECSRRQLPLSFPGTQWEIYLASDARFVGRPYRSSPLVVSTKPGRKPVTFVDAWKRVRGVISPFGPVGAWEEIGKLWGGSGVMELIQDLYPNPPKVLLISNNEAPRSAWTDVESDQHFWDTLGKKRALSADDKRALVGDAWIARYRALQREWRLKLHRSRHPRWGDNTIFAAYSGIGMSQMGRWGGWSLYSLITERRVDPTPLMWDGAMLDGYLMPGRALPKGTSHYPTDYWVFSPQVDYMNDEYFRREALRQNPTFWVELGVWNGDDLFPPQEDKLASFDPPYTPERYGGMVQFGMWLLRPRSVRDFRGGMGRAHNLVYFEQVMAAVDRVHRDPVLRAFWRDSELVGNHSQLHPYQQGIPTFVDASERMYMLTVDSNPPVPWSVFTEIDVYALARVKGEAPSREWLVYAQSPQSGSAGKKVRVTIPAPTASAREHSVIVEVEASAGGTFSIFREGTRLAWKLEDVRSAAYE